LQTPRDYPAGAKRVLRCFHPITGLRIE